MVRDGAPVGARDDSPLAPRGAAGPGVRRSSRPAKDHHRSTVLGPSFPKFRSTRSVPWSLGIAPGAPVAGGDAPLRPDGRLLLGVWDGPSRTPREPSARTSARGVCPRGRVLVRRHDPPFPVLESSGREPSHGDRSRERTLPVPRSQSLNQTLRRFLAPVLTLVPRSSAVSVAVSVAGDVPR